MRTLIPVNVRAHYLFASVAALLLAGATSLQGASSVAGQITDPQGRPAQGAVVTAVAKRPQLRLTQETDAAGRFFFAGVPPGSVTLTVAAPGFAEVTRKLDVSDGEAAAVDLRFEALSARSESVTVTASAPVPDARNPDPAQQLLVRDELLDANPGRPGAPVSIPGLPAETASSGIKAPQYFAPGVAGDHGEPIAQFIQVGTFLLPNNLSANAHGNGYADPNILVPSVIESVTTDGGAFNVREGNHSVDLAVAYGLRSRLEPRATLTADARDVDLSLGWGWLALEGSYGNGFLDALEHRMQYKANAMKQWKLASHKLALLFLGYYGQSKIPGLAPIAVPNLHDTIDPRQREQTHTAWMALNDVWSLSPAAELQLSAFFRTYNLTLLSNFGDGLIRQSEFRTVTGGNANYIGKLSQHISVMAGFDLLRDAPRRDDLDHYLSADTALPGPFVKVTANNITLDSLTPFVALDATLGSWLRFNLGWRRDEILFDNADLLNPANSFLRWAGVNSPKATVSLTPPDGSRFVPAVSFSFGEAFFTNDPRIGSGTGPGSLVNRTHSYQFVAAKTVLGTEFRLTLGHITEEASLAKIDPDTGLQYNEGPGRNRYATASARRRFRRGLVEASVSKADARDLATGAPIPEAPRLIFDVLGTVDRLPFHTQLRAEFEEVGRKPLGDGFTSVPVREFRGALIREFLNGRLETGVHFQIASGYTGQTTEVLALPGEAAPFERIVGVYVPSYASVSAGYRFDKSR